MARWNFRLETRILRKEFVGDEEGKVRGRHGRPWDVNEAGLRAGLDTVLAGVSYLL